MPRKHTKMSKFLDHAVSSADLMSAYVDKAYDELLKLTSKERQELLREIAVASVDTKDTEIVGALAILKNLIETIQQSDRPL